MADPVTESPDIDDGEIGGLRTSSLAELSEARRNTAVGPWWLKRLADWSRTWARIWAPAAFAVNGIGFAFYPRPWNRDWCLDRLACVVVSNIGGWVSLLAIFCCLIAWSLASASSTLRVRPLWPAAGFVAASAILNLLTPRIG